MKWRRLGEAYFLVASALLTAVTVVAFPQALAQAEDLAITGAQLKLVQGSPEDMMRYPSESYFSRDESTYPSPRTGDIVLIVSLFIGRPETWPKVTIIWEDCGARADFDFRDHLGYLNGQVFALLLSNAATWRWLEKATDAELAGMRYVEIQGVPPANYADLLARLPKRRMVVRCNEGVFPSLQDAIVPVEPIGLIYENPGNAQSLDFRVFSTCTFLSITLMWTREICLPPGLKVLHLISEWIMTEPKVTGAEESIEILKLFQLLNFSGWMTRYKALEDVAVASIFMEEKDYLDFAGAVSQLPAIRSLRINAAQWDISFLSKLPELRSLWLTSQQKDFEPVAGLSRLKYLRIEQQSDCDFSALSRLSALEYFALLIGPEDKLTYFDMAALEPIAGKIKQLLLCGHSERLHIVNPEAIAALTSLEDLRFVIYRLPELPVGCLSSLTSLRRISGLFVADPDVSPLAKLPRLECLSLASDGMIDLGGLKSCPALRELAVATRGNLTIEPLASLASLTNLDLSSGLGTGEEPETDCTPLAGLKRLQNLTLNIAGLKSVEFLASMESLSVLTLNRFAGTDLSVLSKMSSLLYLTLASCHDLAPNASIRLPRGLHRLILNGCGKLADLLFLDGAENLEFIYMYACPRVTALPKLSVPLARLTHLIVSQCDGLKDTSGLASMPALEGLEIRWFAGTEMAGFDALSSLRYVYVDRFTHLESIPKAAPGAPIVEARFEGEPTLWSIEGFETWRELRRLDLRLGRGTPDLFYLEALTKLDNLRLVGGDSIADVSSLAKMTWLKRLELTDCPFCTRENLVLLKKALPGCTVSGNAVQ